MSRMDAFLLGFICMASAVAAMFFVRFWRRTSDLLFAAFAAFFLLESVSQVLVLYPPRPNEATPAIYLLQLTGLVLVLAAILSKNLGRSRIKKR